MEAVKLIPRPLRSVQIPNELPVTTLAAARPCLLAPVASEAPSIPSLCAGPQAVLGRILHKLVEDAARGRIHSDSDDDGAVRSRLEWLLHDSQREVHKGSFSKAFANLKECFSFNDWHSRTEIAIAEAVRMLGHSRSHQFAVPIPEDRPGRTIDLNAILRRNGEFTQFEVSFRSRKLRLKGRIDEIAKQSGSIQVIDYKTGRISDDDGNVSAEIVLQLRLYGLAVLECLPGATVHLCVRSGEDYYSVGFTVDDVRQTRSIRAELMRGLPAGQSVQAESLAELGPHCRICRMRHVCPRYRHQITSLWATPRAGFRLPLDTCGIIVAREKSSDGSYSLTLRDTADRMVKIHRIGLSQTEVESMPLFRPVWFFNLCSHEGGMKGPGWNHPRNFYQLPASQGEPQAWSMEFFGEDLRLADGG